MLSNKFMPPVDVWTDWPLQQNALFQLARRKRNGKTLIQPAFDAHKCIFVHVPKAAGTSIKKALFPGTELTHYRALDYFFDNPRKYRHYFVFAFIRNPYDRLVSAYNYLMQGGKNDADLKFRDNILHSYPSFSDFVKFGLRRSAVKNKYHFMPQYPFLVNYWGRIMVDFVGRTEQITMDFSAILEAIGMDARLPHENKSLAEPFKSFYTEELRRIVYTAYRKDFEIFGYSQNIPGD